MANGKGWLDCIDCIFHTFQTDNQNWESFCKKHNQIIPKSDHKKIKQRFCSEFIPNEKEALILNNGIEKNGSELSYLIYNNKSRLYNNSENTKTIILPNILYSYDYTEHKPKEIVKLKNK